MAKWVYLQTKTANAHGPETCSGTILNILRRRGVAEDCFDDFLSPHPKTTYDPFLMPDLGPCVDRLLTAFERGERVCVYGDYDADGVTSTVLLLEVFRRLTGNFCYHIPNRFTEGYGLNKKAIDTLAGDSVDLIVTVDCGSTSPDEAAYAREKGMDIIISDHHTLCEHRSPACIFLNPKRTGSEYPFKQLSGCGVAFKIAQGVQRRLKEAGDERFGKKELDALLDLVAISTVADIVPLLDENRTLVKYGLAVLNQHRRPGLNALLKELSLFDRKVEADHIAFQIAPNINALGRMGTADVAVELLSAGEGSDPMRLASLAYSMVSNNEIRKSEQEKTRRLCAEAMDSGVCGELFPIIYAPEGHEGVAGIVAGNFKEDLYRPVCIVTKGDEGLLKGTGRSVPGLDLYHLLEECEEYFVRFGGHAGACGFCMSPDNLEVFRARMQEAVRRKAKEDPEILTEKIYIEKELDKDEKTLSFADALSALEPFGEGNARPLFSVCGAELVALRFMGAEEQHARFTVKGSDGVPVECILFRKAPDYAPLLRLGSPVDVAGELSVNEFNGSRRLQLVVRDLRPGVRP